MHRFFSSIDRIVVTSPNYLASSEVLKKYRHNTEIIPIGLNASDYPRASEELKEKWRLRFPRPFFLFVGVLRYYKGLHTLIEASKHVDADILVVGEGPMEAELKTRVIKSGLTNLHFLGGVNDIDKAALLDLCTAFVFPSHLRSEAYGLSLVEAAMFGKPMISCEIGTGTSFVNVHNVTGLVTNPNDSSDFATAMNVMLHDKELVKRFGANAYSRFRSELSADLMVERYCHLYRELKRFRSAGKRGI